MGLLDMIGDKCEEVEGRDEGNDSRAKSGWRILIVFGEAGEAARLTQWISGLDVAGIGVAQWTQNSCNGLMPHGISL